MPALDWKHDNDGNKLRLAIKSNTAPTAVRLWTATSATKDFRESKWTSQPIKETSGMFTAEVAQPDQGHVAIYGEAQFNAYGLTYSLTTQIRRE